MSCHAACSMQHAACKRQGRKLACANRDQPTIHSSLVSAFWDCHLCSMGFLQCLSFFTVREDSCIIPPFSFLRCVALHLPPPSPPSSPSPPLRWVKEHNLKASHALPIYLDCSSSNTLANNRSSLVRPSVCSFKGRTCLHRDAAASGNECSWSNERGHRRFKACHIRIVLGYLKNINHNPSFPFRCPA